MIFIEILLEAHDLSVSFGERTLFTLPRLTVHRGDRIGLVGANGCGKTTLMQLLAGKARPDAGSVTRLCPVGYAPQFGTGEGNADARELRVFGVADKKADTPLSGGEEVRLRLSRTPFGAPLLLLDEPTANLDLHGKELFARRLATQESFLLISHDRSLLDECCNRIWMLENGAVTFYDGNYRDCEAARELAKTTQNRAWEQYTAEKAALEKNIRGLTEKSASIRKTPTRMGNSEARLHKMGGQGAKKKLDQQRKAAQSRLDRLEKTERVRDIAPMQLDFTLTAPPEVRTVLQCSDLSYAYPDRPPVLHGVSCALRNGSKTALMGANGCGKSTLLHLLQAGHPALRITPRARLGFLNQDLSTIDPKRTVLENARRFAVQQEHVIRIVLGRMQLQKSLWEKPASTLSGGEKIKLCLCQLIVSDCNVLVLDEPTNYLDLPSLTALEDVLTEYPGTVLFVSHDRSFVAHVADCIWTMADGRITAFDGTLAALEGDATPAKDDHLTESLLRMRMTELIGRISSAPPKVKEELEKSYAACLSELQALQRQ